MPLTDTVIRNTKPGANDSKMSDGGGLFLLVKTTGAKWWRFSYRYAGKQKTLSFGVYPDIGLKDARERRDEAKKLLAQGVDPGAVRKAQKSGTLERAANSFEVVAREWFEKGKGDKAISHPPSGKGRVPLAWWCSCRRASGRHAQSAGSAAPD